MNLLAIETSTDACSVGLSVQGELLLDHRLAAQKHAGLVLPMIDALMSEAGISPAQLDGIAFGRGPGSFTGVRIGVALTQGIALGADIGVVGISTLQSVAQGVHRCFHDKSIAVCLDARMSEVYFAAYGAGENGLVTALTEEYVCPLNAVFEHLPKASWTWAGAGAERYSKELLSLVGNDEENPLVVRPDAWPNAQDLLALAMPDAVSGKLTSPENAMPVYLRNNVAQTTAEREAARSA